MIIIFLLFPNFYQDQKQIHYQGHLKNLWKGQGVRPYFALHQLSMQQWENEVSIYLTKINLQNIASLKAIYVALDLQGQSYPLSSSKTKLSFSLQPELFQFISRTIRLAIYFIVQTMLPAIIGLSLLTLSSRLIQVPIVLNWYVGRKVLES